MKTLKKIAKQGSQRAVVIILLVFSLLSAGRFREAKYDQLIIQEFVTRRY